MPAVGRPWPSDDNDDEQCSVLAYYEDRIWRVAEEGGSSHWQPATGNDDGFDKHHGHDDDGDDDGHDGDQLYELNYQIMP